MNAKLFKLIRQNKYAHARNTSKFLSLTFSVLLERGCPFVFTNTYMRLLFFNFLFLVDFIVITEEKKNNQIPYLSIHIFEREKGLEKIEGKRMAASKRFVLLLLMRPISFNLFSILFFNSKMKSSSLIKIYDRIQEIRFCGAF